MPIVRAGTTEFDVDAVAFDKDGTLIDLQATWGPLAGAWIDGVTAAVSDGRRIDDVRRGLALRLGYDLTDGSLVADGVMAAGTLDQIRAATAEVLVGHGFDHGGLAAALAHGSRAVADVGHVDPVPLADLVTLFGSLHTARCRCAIVTSDDRTSALDVIDRFGLAEFVSIVVAGDDSTRPKPAPDPLVTIAARLGVDVTRILMVGDSTTDQGAARAAGCPFVAVGRHGSAATDCDAVIDHVGDITVTAQP